MAKKKAGKKKGNGKKKSGGKFGIDVPKMIGIGAGVLAKKKGLDQLEFLNGIEDPKMRALAKIAIGEFGPKQDFVRGMIKDDKMLNGAGDAIVTLGMADLLTEMNIAGVGALNDTDDLAVVIDGIDDIDSVNDDRLSRGSRRRRDEDEIDEDVLADDDIDSVNDDDDDEMSEDVLADDIDAVNDDEDEDY